MSVRHILCGAAVLAAAVCSHACAAGYFGDTASPTAPSGPVATPPAGVSPAYTQDIKPILDADCVRCHGSKSPSAGVDLSSYTGTMRVVVAGSANSRLVVATKSGGAMYTMFSGDRAGKSALIKSWVTSGAAQNR